MKPYLTISSAWAQADSSERTKVYNLRGHPSVPTVLNFLRVLPSNIHQYEIITMKRKTMHVTAPICDFKF